jgi:hypothetical protein
MYIELSSIEESMAQFLKKNKNIAFQSANFYDERKLKTILASSTAQNNYDCIIVGSSTSRYLNSRSSNFKNCLNLSITGADLEENFALLLIALERFDVKTVVMDINVSIFSKMNWSPKNRKYPALMHEKLKSINKLGAEMQAPPTAYSYDHIVSTIHYYLELINGHYLIASLNKVFLLATSNSGFKSCDDVAAYVVCVNNDGSSSFDKRILQAVEKSHIVSLPPYWNDKNFEFSQSKLSLMDSFLEVLAHKGITTSFYFPPTRPDLYLELAKTEWYDKNLLLIKNLVEKYNIRTHGSHDPFIFGCVMEDFDDDVHVNEGCIKKIWPIKNSPI